MNDRFDQIIESCDILDVDDSCDVDTLFEQLAELLSKGDGASKRSIKESLWQREQDSSTVISAGLAVPHIILEGTGRFDIMFHKLKNRRGSLGRYLLREAEN